MQLSDLNTLLNATGGFAGGVKEEGWTRILNDTECCDKGLDVRGLFRLYLMQGESLQDDYDVIFPEVSELWDCKGSLMAAPVDGGRF